MLAYLNIDQDEVSDYIKTHEIDVKNWDQAQKVANYFFSKTSIRCGLYVFNEDCAIHEIFTSYSTSFIRDEKRFTNRRYQEILEKKYNRAFPYCLENINWYVRSNHDAIEVANELRIFFPDDNRLMCFAEWLEDTATFCNTYELSF